MLKLAGLLDPKLGGPPLDPKKKGTLFRRSLYFIHSKGNRHKFLMMFDDADVLECYRRAESILPQQALAMVNSRLSLDVAARIAKRLGDSPDGRFVDAAFETVLGASPTAAERRICLESLEKLKKAAAPRARANLVHALLNHNDFVTIR